MIYRIAELADWQRAKDIGFFASADLALEGFIHCSEKHQVLLTAGRYFKGRAHMLVLEIDDTTLGESLKREDFTGRGEKFPHIYAPIPLASIKRTLDIVETASGFKFESE
jgi:uncharacterized protein (DUF952 family)